MKDSGSISFGVQVSIYCEKCYKVDEDPSPILMLRSTGPFTINGMPGEVGDFYRCSRCMNSVSMVCQINPGEFQSSEE